MNNDYIQGIMFAAPGFWLLARISTCFYFITAYDYVYEKTCSYIGH